MHYLTKTFFNLLKHRIKINNKEVPVLINYLPKDDTPCITFNLASTVFIKRYLKNITPPGMDYPVQIKNKEYKAVLLD